MYSLQPFFFLAPFDLTAFVSTRSLVLYHWRRPFALHTEHGSCHSFTTRSIVCVQHYQRDRRVSCYHLVSCSVQYSLAWRCCWGCCFGWTMNFGGCCWYPYGIAYFVVVVTVGRIMSLEQQWLGKERAALFSFLLISGSAIPFEF